MKHCELCDNNYECWLDDMTKVACPNCIGYVSKSGNVYCTNKHCDNVEVDSARNWLSDVIGCEMHELDCECEVQ